MSVDLTYILSLLSEQEGDAIKAIIAERDGLKAENERLREVLIEAIVHVSHDDNCPGGKYCNCDYRDWQNKAYAAMEIKP